MAETITYKVVMDTTSAEVSLDQLNNQIEEVDNSTKELNDTNVEHGKIVTALDQFTGGLAGQVVALGEGLKEGIKGTKGLSTAFKGMRTALIATGIGALVVSLGLIVAYWDDIKEAITGVNRKMRESIDKHISVRDTVGEEYNLLLKQQEILKLQGKGLNEIRRTRKQNLLTQQEENEQALQELQTLYEKKVLEDRGITAWEKIKIGIMGAISFGKGYALQVGKSMQLSESTLALTEEIRAAESKKLDIQKELLLLDKEISDEQEANHEQWKKNQSEKEQKQKQLSEIEAKRREAEIAAEQARIKEEQKMLDEEIAQNEKSIQDEFDRQRLVAMQTIENEEMLSQTLAQIEIDRLERLKVEREDYNQASLDLDLQLAEQKRAIARQEEAERQKAAEKQIQLEEEVAKSKDEIQKQSLDAISSIFGEQSKIGKAAAIAKATMDTYQAANNALANTPAPMPFPLIAAGTALAAGLANVKKILETDESGSISTGSIGGGISTPSVGLLSAQVNPNTQLISSIDNAMNKAPKAYVVGQDVTTQQNLDRYIGQNATLSE